MKFGLEGPPENHLLNCDACQALIDVQKPMLQVKSQQTNVHDIDAPTRLNTRLYSCNWKNSKMLERNRHDFKWRSFAWSSESSRGLLSTESIQSDSFTIAAAPMETSSSCPASRSLRSFIQTAKNDVRTLDVQAFKRNSGYSPALTAITVTGMYGW